MLEDERERDVFQGGGGLFMLAVLIHEGGSADLSKVKSTPTRGNGELGLQKSFLSLVRRHITLIAPCPCEVKDSPHRNAQRDLYSEEEARLDLRNP